jgi:hypothetical protein
LPTVQDCVDELRAQKRRGRQDDGHSGGDTVAVGTLRELRAIANLTSRVIAFDSAFASPLRPSVVKPEVFVARAVVDAVDHDR